MSRANLNPPAPQNTNLVEKVVEIKSVNWNKDSHGLFDYENNLYDMMKFQV